MFSALKQLLFHYRQLRRFKKLPASSRQIIFYAPDRSTWLYVKPMVLRLIHHYHHDIVYLTSADDDPVLNIDNDRIHAFAIGKGVVRSIALFHLPCRAVITTTPQLHKFYSAHPDQPPQCIFVHNSMVSIHTAYPKGALDLFDTVFCAGPHHASEIRAMERLYDLNRKTLIRYGFGKLDIIMNKAANDDYTNKRLRNRRKHILIAPSSGMGNISETVAIELIRRLLAHGYFVTFRPHSDTRKYAPKTLAAIRRLFGTNQYFSIEEGDVLTEAFFMADLMVSDWSGVALEYAFGLECPVLYIDTPRKISNDEYDRVRHTPLEDSIRTQIGEVLSPNKLDQLTELTDYMIANRYQYIKSIIEHRNRYVFNIGKSDRYGAKYIDNLLKSATW